MPDTDDYVLERIITLNRLMTDKQIKECRRIQQEEEPGKSLDKIIVDHGFLTEKIIDKIKKMEANDGIEEKLTKAEQNSGNPQPSSEGTGFFYSASENDMIFIKIALHNNILLSDQVKEMKKIIEKQGKSAWAVAAESGFIKPRIINKILKKLDAKFSGEFTDRVSTDIQPESKATKTVPAESSPSTPPSVDPKSETVQLRKKDHGSEKENITDDSAQENIPDPSSLPSEALEPIQDGLLEPVPVDSLEVVEPEPAPEIKPAAASAFEQMAKKTSTINSLSDAHKRFMRHTMSSRLHFQIMRHIYDHKSETIIPKEMASMFGEKERKIRKLLKELAKYGILTEMGREVYNYNPSGDEKKMIRELMAYFNTTEGHSKIMSYILSLE